MLHLSLSQTRKNKVEGGMVEAGAMFATLMALIKIIEKLVDKKMGNGNGPKPVQIDLNQTEMANSMGQMVECMASTTQTLERINDKIDGVHEKSTKIETLTDTIDGRIKDIQDVSHKTKNMMEQERIAQQVRKETLAELRDETRGT
jgi:methyl-accepting chemotaxis protein